MLIAATPIDIASKAVGFSGFVGASLYVLYYSVVDCLN